MAKPKRILILNNYSVGRVTNEINSGLKPAHHLYGILELADAGFELVIIDPERNKFWDKVGSILNKIPVFTFGDLYLQIRAFKRRDEYDIVYAPCQTVTQFLGFLNFFGLYKKRIIAIAHHPFLVGRLSFLRRFGFYITLRGHYRWGALSSVVANEINSITKLSTAKCFHWGPDIRFFDKVAAKNVGLDDKPVDIISIGRTGRDYQVLIDAFNNTDVKLEIYCSGQSVKDLSKDYTPNIKIINLDSEESLNYLDVTKLYQTAKIMAIPMLAHKSLAGLTSLTDAMALGMPVIISKNGYIEIDIEKEDIGFVVDIGSSPQWRDKTIELLKSENLKRTGSNSRKIAEQGYNTDIFFSELLSAVSE